MPRTLSCIGLVLFSASVATAQTIGLTTPPPDFSQRVARVGEFVRQQMQRDQIPGVSLGIQWGDSVWTGGFGVADVENQVPATAQTSYRIASVTKPMSATAVFQLSNATCGF